MIGSVFAIAAASLEAQARQQARNAEWEATPEERRGDLLNRWREHDEREDIERRQRELCQAIRDSRRVFGVFL